MISKVAGENLKRNTKSRIWWIKLAIAILVSNAFFFLFFSSNGNKSKSNELTAGQVEIAIQAQLLTPFQKGKKVLLLNRMARQKVEALLESFSTDPEGRITVIVMDSEAHRLLQYERWEIVPYLTTFTLGPVKNGETHEIRY